MGNRDQVGAAVCGHTEDVLTVGLEPEPHGPQPAEKAILVNRNRLVRGIVALTEKGVSQRGVSFCLEELLDTRMSPSWVNAELAKAEGKATAINETVNRCLARAAARVLQLGSCRLRLLIAPYSGC